MGVNVKGLFVILCFGSVFAQDSPSFSSSESIKDQLREGYNKETSEYNASHPGRASDNILPHIFNM